MKITDVNSYIVCTDEGSSRCMIFVEIQTDEGITAVRMFDEQKPRERNQG